MMHGATLQTRCTEQEARRTHGGVRLRVSAKSMIWPAAFFWLAASRQCHRIETVSLRLIMAAVGRCVPGRAAGKEVDLSDHCGVKDAAVSSGAS
jgi:hypothetical protein